MLLDGRLLLFISNALSFGVNRSHGLLGKSHCFARTIRLPMRAEPDVPWIRSLGQDAAQSLMVLRDESPHITQISQVLFFLRGILGTNALRDLV